jgi:hypothetical protein
MFGSRSLSLSRHLRSIQNHSSSQLFEALNLLILRWCALIVLYGEAGLRSPWRNKEN